MNVQRAVFEGRRNAEQLMTTTVTVGTITTVMDPETLEDVEVIVPTYTGKAKIRHQSIGVSDRNAGGQVLAIQELILSLPVIGSETVAVSHAVEVTANPLDPALIGARFRIKGVHEQTNATARRFPIERTS